MEYRQRWSQWLWFFRRSLTALIILSGITSVALAVNTCGIFACTGFAVYDNEPIYGMNFDYPPRELRFSLTSTQGRQVFRMEFPQEGSWYSTVGMNSDGVFSSAQMLYPVLPAVQAGPDDLYIWAAADYALEQSSSASAVLSLVNSRRLVEGETSLHVLVADSTGTSFVLEPGVSGNRITPIKDRFLVMTNFPLADYAGQNYLQTRGAGADRYQKAWPFIQSNLNDFGAAQAMETLNLARNSGASPTLVSMVFLPQREEVLIALDGDQSKLWKASLKERIISTEKGFEGNGSLALDEKGVLASSLRSIPTSVDSDWLPLLPWLLGGLVVGIVLGFSLWRWSRRKRT